MAAYERTGRYEGVYHVLNGVINPSQGIGPQEIRLKELMIRHPGRESRQGGEKRAEGKSPQRKLRQRG